MKKIQIISILFLLILMKNNYCVSQVISLKGFVPNQMDMYEKKVLLMGHDWDKKGTYSVYTKDINQTDLTDITKHIDLALNGNSKVRFDNYGNIWAFGKYNLWKFDGLVWSVFPTHPDLLPSRYFYDFVFDDENNIWASTRTNFERLRTNDGGTVVVVLDSFQNEFIKISTINTDFEVMKKYYFDEADFVTAIHAITKRNDGAIVIHQNGEKDNLIIYKDGNTEYQTTPIIASGMNSNVSSMTYDKNNNLWITVTTHDYQLAPYNGVYKISPDGSFTYWDSSAGLRYEHYTPRGIRAILGVETLSVSDSGEVWCGTEFGFFSINESKPWKEQITFYTRDSVDNRFMFYKSNISILGKVFNITDISHYGNDFFFAGTLGYIELLKNDTISSVIENSSTPAIGMEVFPSLSTKSEVLLTIRNAEFVNNAYLSIVDLSGRAVQNMHIEGSSGQISIPIDTKNLPSGIYYAVLQIGGNITTKKFIVQ